MAMVGCGAIAQVHLYAIEKSGAPIDVVAAVDPDRERAAAVAARTGATPFASLDEALSGASFDAVDLMIPHHLHERLAVRAFEADKHVLLEKPMAPEVDACERILEAARGSGRVFLVAENAQYWPEVLHAKDAIEAGAIGEPVTARACVFFPPLPEYYGDGGWRYDRTATGGGIAIDTGSHWIRPLRMLMGEIDEVVAGLARPVDAMEGESLVRAVLRFRSGKLGSFDALLTRASLGPEPFFRVTGSEGEITIDAAGQATLFDRHHPAGTALGPAGGYFESYPGEFSDFAAAVLNGTRPAADAAYSLGELRTALAMYRSAESRRWEKVWA